jgi:Xaa-Pro dipeptidase
MSHQRLSHLIEGMQQAGLDAIALNPSPTQKYLCGLHLHLMERPTLLLIAPLATPVLILPELEAAKLADAPYLIHGLTYSDNPATWPAVFEQAAAALNLDGKTIGVEPTWLRFLELEYLRGCAPSAKFTSAEPVIAAMRMQKDPQEIDAMRRAVQIAQDALRTTLPMIHPGVTELQIASELTANLLKAGSEARMPFFPIVSGGPNSANPHASPSDRPLQSGDLLVIDWGAGCQGYFSDLTRTFAIGEVEPEFKRIAEVVRLANQSGRAAGKPGVPAGSVDRATRKVIDDAGYASYFFHRTGHGLGMEAHEPPYMFGENPLTLLPGMTYTVEPGIYLTGRGGVRIEDNMVVTESGCETLSDLPRELIRL